MRARLGLIGTAVAALAIAGCGGPEQNVSAPSSAEAGSASPKVTGPEPAAVPAAAPQGPALAEADSQNGDFRMAVTEATRSNGVLTIKTRVTLLDGETGSRRLLYSNEPEELYLVAGDQKYMMLKDNEGEALSPEEYSPSFRRLGDSSLWWGKFPAPPPEVKTVGFYFKNFLPIENIPITDR